MCLTGHNPFRKRTVNETRLIKPGNTKEIQISSNYTFPCCNRTWNICLTFSHHLCDTDMVLVLDYVKGVKFTPVKNNLQETNADIIIE